MLKDSKIGKIIFWTIIVLMVGCFTFIFAVIPVSNDDWAFKRAIEDGGMISHLTIRFYSDNVRLANLLDSMLLLVPKFIPVLICSVAFAIGFWLMTKITGIKNGQWRLMALFSFLLWVAPMWEDAMFCHVFAFNYVFTIPLLFGMMFVFLHPDKFKLWIALVLGVLLGAFHESYSIAFMAGSVLTFVIRSDMRTKKRIWMLFFVFIGFLWFLCTPAIYSRQSFQTFSNSANYPKLMYCWICFLYLVVWILGFIKRRSFVKSPLHLFAFGSISLLIISAFAGAARASMPAILLCCCGLTDVVHRFACKYSLRIKNIVAVVLFLFTASSLVAVCVETVKLRRICDKVADIYINSPRGTKTAFSEMSFPWDAPMIALRRPDYQLTPYGQRNWMWLYVYSKNDIFIIPEELRHFKFEEAVKLDGNNDCVIWNGHILSPNINDTVYTHALVGYNLRNEYTNIKGATFYNDEGHEYVYILPARSAISTYLGAPKSIVF